jgi:DNA primase
MEFILEYFQKQYDLSNYTNKREYINRVMEEINGISDAMDRENYKHRLADITGVNYSVLTLDQPQQGKPVKIPQTPSEPISAPKISRNGTGLEIAQKTIIKQMMLSKRAIEIFKQQLAKLPDKQLNELAMQIIDYSSQNGKVVVSELVSQLSDEMSSLVCDISADEMFRNEYDQETLNDAIITVRINELEERKKEINNQVKMIKDYIVQGKLLNQRTELTRQIKELNDQKSQRVRRKD